MELADTWTCGCGAENTGDVFYGTCWKCGVSWEKEPVKIDDAKDLNMCVECRATDGFHTMNCSIAEWPDWYKKQLEKEK